MGNKCIFMVPGTCIILTYQAIVLCFLLAILLHLTVLHSEGQLQLLQDIFLNAEVVCSVS